VTAISTLHMFGIPPRSATSTTLTPYTCPQTSSSGHASTDYVLIGSTLPGPKYLLRCIGVLGALGMALMMCISAQLKHRKLRRMYSRLVTKDDPSIEMAAPETLMDDDHGHKAH